jgi:hypothetical protein
MLKPIAIATAIAGTLDLLAAFVFAGLAGTSPVGVLQFVASGPLGDAALANPAYAVAGFLVHFSIMACMVTAYMLVARQWRTLLDRPILAGALYGLLLWFVMYWVVRPLRWHMPYPSHLYPIANQLFCHVLLVGITIGLVAARYLRSPGPSQ